jgi:hypothetical protein
MDEKERKELSDFFKKNPKVERLVNETRDIFRDLDKAIEDAPPDRPHPQLKPGGSLSPNSPGTQARTKGVYMGIKQEAKTLYEKKFDELTINYDEKTKHRFLDMSYKYVYQKEEERRKNQTKEERLKDDFSESKNDIQRGDVSKRIIDSLWSSRVGKGIEPEPDNDGPDKGKSDKSKPKDKDMEPSKD